MVANPSKFQLMFHSKCKTLKESRLLMENPLKHHTAELFEIALDKIIKFKRLTKYLSQSKLQNQSSFPHKKIPKLLTSASISRAYISSNVRYRPLIWVFCGKRVTKLF